MKLPSSLSVDTVLQGVALEEGEFDGDQLLGLDEIAVSSQRIVLYAWDPGVFVVVAYDLGDGFLYVAEGTGEEPDVLTWIIPQAKGEETIRLIEREYVRWYPGSGILTDEFGALHREEPWLIREIVHSLLEQSNQRLDETDIYDEFESYLDAFGDRPSRVAQIWLGAVETKLSTTPDWVPPGLCETGLRSAAFDLWLDQDEVRWRDTNMLLTADEARMLRLVCWYLARAYVPDQRD